MGAMKAVVQQSGPAHADGALNVRGLTKDTPAAGSAGGGPQMATGSSSPIIQLDASVHGYPSPPGLQFPSASPSTSTTSSTASLSSLSLSDQVQHTLQTRDHDMDSPSQDMPGHESDEVLAKWRRQLGMDSSSASKRGSTTPDPSVICPPKPKTLRSSFDASDAQQSVGPSFDSQATSQDAAPTPISPCPPLTSTSSSSSTYTVSSAATPSSSGEVMRDRDSHSPSDSPASTAREGLTPKAELPPLVWPMSSAHSSSTTLRSPQHMPATLSAEGQNLSASPMSIDDVLAMQSGAKDAKVERSGSWRKKYASMDTGTTTTPHLSRAPSDNEIRGRQHASCYPPSSSKNATHAGPSGRRYSENAYQVNADEKLLAFGAMTGCRISAPISPPSHYPATSSRRASSRSSARSSTHHSAATAPPASTSVSAAANGLPVTERTTSPSVCSTSSNTSSPGLTSGSSSSTMPSSATIPPRVDTAIAPDLYPTFVTPDTPRWARPMRHTNSMSMKSWAEDGDKVKQSSNDKPLQGSDEEEDFDQDMFRLEGEEDGPVEVIKGEQGRIAVRSSMRMYEILVWLPGFSMGDITIAGRAHKTLHVVADKWDEGDHVSNYIKLGDDADMKSIGAKFNGQELRVTVGRLSARKDSRSIKTSTSLPAGTATAGTAFATTGHAGQRQSFLQAKTSRSASSSSANKPGLLGPSV